MIAPQIACPPKLPDRPTVVGERDGSPVVERPNSAAGCATARVELVATQLVSSVQSYLDVERC